jgi:hypothetical protein
MLMSPAKRPDDFVQNEERAYKPLRKKADDPASKIARLKKQAAIDGEDHADEIAEVESEIEQIKLRGSAGGENRNIGETADLFSTGMQVEPVVDLHSASYREKQLKIEKQRIELLKARNELIAVKEAENEWRGMGVTLRAEFDKMSTQLAPRLAPIHDPRQIKAALSAAFAELCDKIWKAVDEGNA